MKRKLLLIILSVILGVGLGFSIDYLKHGSFAWAVNNNPNFDSWTSGLVGYWSFNGQSMQNLDGGINATATDMSGYGNHGSATGTMSGAAGAVEQALLFDGTDDFVEVADAAVLDVDYLSLEAWIKLEVATDSQAIITKWSDTEAPADNRSFRLTIGESTTGISEVKPCLALNATGTSGVGGVVCSDSTLNANQWYFVSATYDGSYVEMYINGTFENQTAYSSGIYKGIFPLRIGKRAASIPLYFNGLIDEVRIYNRALSAAEVQAHYSLSRRKFITSTPNPHDWSNGLVGYWTFNGQNIILNATATDLSGNGNHGTLGSDVGSDTSDPTPAAGAVGQSLSFDGVNDYVEVAHDASQLLTTGGSIEAWIKADTVGEGTSVNKGRIVDKSADATALNGFTFTVEDSNRLVAWINNGTKKASAGNSVMIGDGNFYHVVVTWDDAGLLNFYVNGALSGAANQATGDPAGITTTNAMRIGNRSGATDRTFDGLIDEVRVYNRALSAEEVKEHYSLTRRKFVAATPNPHDWSNGLVGYWTFNGQNIILNATATDISGYGNNGTLGTGVGSDISDPTPIAGVVGQALSFDGVNDYVNAGDPANGSLDFGTGNFSIEVWVKSLGSQSASAVLHKLNTTGVPYSGYEIYTLGTDVRFLVNNMGWADGSTTTLPVGEWTHLVGVRISNTEYLYKNGVLAYSVTNATIASSTDNGGSYYIGRRQWAQFFNGLIDEVRIYNRALSAEEIQEHYSLTKRNLGI